MNSVAEIIYSPGPSSNTVLAADGRVLNAPEGWVLLSPGDAALTRRVKTAGEHWVVQEKKGRKIFSRGVWAPSATIEKINAELIVEREKPQYQKRKASDAVRREKTQAAYEEEFFEEVVCYLDFHPKFTTLAELMAKAVADHATPVGSGTVARTQRIPVEERAEAAVLAWMRHHTTDYDRRIIPRVKGKRREVRRELAKASKALLDRYRKSDVATDDLLEKALQAVSVRNNQNSQV